MTSSFYVYLILSILGGPYPISIPSRKHGRAWASLGLQHSPLGCAAYCVHHFSGWSDTTLRLNSLAKWQEAHVRTGLRQVTISMPSLAGLTCLLLNPQPLITFVLFVLYTVRFSSGAEFYEKMENTFLNRQVQFLWTILLFPCTQALKVMLFAFKIVFLDEKVLLQ